MSYERTVAAALAETQSKRRLAEALATDIPVRLGRLRRLRPHPVRRLVPWPIRWLLGWR